VAWIPLAVLAQGYLLVRRCLDHAGDAGGAPAVEHGGILRAGDPPRRLVQRAQLDVLGAALGVLELRTGDGERRPELDEPENTPLPRGDALLG
jgi:hypothetical protein